jgi:hypothetical protein
VTDLVGVGISEEAARDYVAGVRRAAVGELEERLYVLEGRVAQHVQGAIRIPGPGHPMADQWRELLEACGRWVVNFTVDGRRLFTRDGSDGLDTYLERYDPGAVNVNAAAAVFAHDVAAVLELRRQRGAVMRDGLPDPRSIAVDQYELAALAGPFDDAVHTVREVEEERILADHWAELDYLTGVAPLLSPDPVYDNVYSVADPVGIKEIGERLNVRRRTVDQWLQRRLLPDAQYVVGGRPAWEWSVVEAWARDSGRLEPVDDAS